jgi:DegV family protein with EDD domain
MTLFQRIGKMLPGRKAVPPKAVRVVTDSTADLPPAIADELGITIVPLHVLFGHESFRDGVDLTSEEFFHKLATARDLPTTSQPSVGEFQEIYEGLARETDRIVSVHLSERFSGTIGAARQAAHTIAGHCSIEVIDSGTTSMGMGMGVIAAARAANDGAELDACAEATRAVFSRQRIAVALDTLEFLRRGGRIGRAQALLGGLLRLKPIVTIRDGEVHPLARVRTRRKALDEVVNICLQDNATIEQAAVLHATTPDDADMIAETLRQRFPQASIHVGRFGPVIGVHGGPGLVGVAAVLAADSSP